MMMERAADSKRDHKKQRIKQYFLEAAREIIVKEGVENVTVRKVADLAGYSYATIYNYFPDLNALLWDVKKLMIGDLLEYMQKNIPPAVKDTKGIKSLFETYIGYHFRNPHVFAFFYFHRLARPESGVEGTEAGPDFRTMWGETFKCFVTEGILEEKDIEVMAKIFIYAIHGMIALCLSNNGDLTEERVYDELESMVDYLLRKR